MASFVDIGMQVLGWTVIVASSATLLLGYGLLWRMAYVMWKNRNNKNG